MVQDQRPHQAKNKRCYIIAEIGSNHDGNLQRAKELIALAKASGADAAKFQSFAPSTLVFNAHPAKSMIEESQVPLEWHEELKKIADKAGIDFLSTPFDLKRLELLAKLKVPYLKFASGDLTYFELLKSAGKYGIPILLATGHSQMNEVESALDVLKQGGASQITLLHCTSLYPTNSNEVNLNAITTLKNRFGLPVGLSDHTLDEVAPLGAVALGAEVIEKHFTDDRSRKGADHPHSLMPGEFELMVKKIRQLESSMGSGEKVPFPREESERIWARRALYAAASIPKGTKLVREHLKVVRPAALDAIAAPDLEKVLGKITKNAINEDAIIRWNDLES